MALADDRQQTSILPNDGPQEVNEDTDDGTGLTSIIDHTSWQYG